MITFLEIKEKGAFIMENREYSEDIAYQIDLYLRAGKNWKFSFDTEMHTFRFEREIKGELKKIAFSICIGADCFIVYAWPLLSANKDDEDIIATTAQFICLFNNGRLYDTMDFDLESGDICYRRYEKCDGSLPTDELIEACIFTPIVIFEDMGSIFADVISGKFTVKDAIYAYEKFQEETENQRADIDALLEILEADDIEEDDEEEKNYTPEQMKEIEELTEWLCTHYLDEDEEDDEED